MIIVEGPDGGGKTTLLRQLHPIMGFDIAPRVVGQDTEAMADLQLWVEHNLKIGFQRRFFDRHRLISEFIYGPVLRRESEPGFTGSAWCGAMIQEFYRLAPVVIYCIPPMEVITENLSHDPNNDRVRAHTPAIYQSYLERAWLDSLINPFSTIYDYTRDGQEENHLTPLIRLINRRLQWRLN